MSDMNGTHDSAPPVAIERIPASALVVSDHDRGDVLWDPAMFAHGQRLAAMFAQSALVPDHLRGKVPDVLIALSIARRLGEDPLTVMQNIHVVKGKPGWSAAYLIARAARHGINVRWRIERRPNRLRIDGNRTMPDLTVTAWAKLPGEDEPVDYAVDSQQAIDAGWAKNEQYTHSAELMLRYRSATHLLRFYAPSILLGLPTEDEAQDTSSVELLSTEPPPATARPRGFDAIDAVLGSSTPSPTPPAPSPSQATGAGGPATEAAPPRHAATPLTDAQLLANVLASHPTPAQVDTTAKELFRAATGLSRVSTERWTECLRVGEAAGLFKRQNGALVVPRPVEPAVDGDAPPNIPDELAIAIHEWETTLGAAATLEVAESVGIPTPGDVPDIAEVTPGEAERYLAALKARAGGK